MKENYVQINIILPKCYFRIYPLYHLLHMYEVKKLTHFKYISYDFFTVIRIHSSVGYKCKEWKNSRPTPQYVTPFYSSF